MKPPIVLKDSPQTRAALSAALRLIRATKAAQSKTEAA